MKLIPTIFAFVLAVPFIVSPYSSAQELEIFRVCTRSEYPRFTSTRIEPIGLATQQQAHYLYVRFYGIFKGDDRESSFPVVYKVEGGSCTIVYENFSGHDTPLEYSLPKTVAKSLSQQADQYFQKRD